jgi:hypothetical protein
LTKNYGRKGEESFVERFLLVPKIKTVYMNNIILLLILFFLYLKNKIIIFASSYEFEYYVGSLRFVEYTVDLNF